MGVRERGQEDGNKGVLDTGDHSATLANFSDRLRKVRKEKIKLVTVRKHGCQG